MDRALNISDVSAGEVGEDVDNTVESWSPAQHNVTTYTISRVADEVSETTAQDSAGDTGGEAGADVSNDPVKVRSMLDTGLQERGHGLVSVVTKTGVIHQSRQTV